MFFGLLKMILAKRTIVATIYNIDEKAPSPGILTSTFLSPIKLPTPIPDSID